MTLNLDPDSFGKKIFPFLEKFFGPLNVWTYESQLQFSSHAFSNATFVLIILTIPWKWSWVLALGPLLLALWQELFRDGHLKDFYKNTPSGIDGKTDLLSRGMGATLPFLTLLLRLIH